MHRSRHPILVSGSITYDRILDFPGTFSEHILPEHLHDLSVAFYVRNVSETYGGTGANIAYNLGLLSMRPALLSVAGGDFAPFQSWLRKHGVDTQYVRIHKQERTSQVYIMTDRVNSQISAFYPGASSHLTRLPNLRHLHASFAIASPAGLEDTWRMATRYRRAGIPFAFDPGQRVTALSKQQLLAGLTGATMLFVNEYEYALLGKKTALREAELLKRVRVVITTMGVRGSTIRSGRNRVHVRAVRPKRVVDPTGAGDAYRAGFLYAYLHELDLRTCAEIGSTCSTFAIEQYGTQQHTFTRASIQRRLKQHYGKSVTLP